MVKLMSNTNNEPNEFGSDGATMPVKDSAEKTSETKKSFIDKFKGIRNNPTGTKTDKAGLWAKIGFVLGIISIIAWLVPVVGVILGLVVTISGLVFNIIGLRAQKGRWFAVAGLTLSIIFFNLTIMMGFYNLLISMLSASGL
jgi:hypothetical protein